MPIHPYTPAPPYHPPAGGYGYTPRPYPPPYGHPPAVAHAPDYSSPPACAKNVTVAKHGVVPKNYCLEDYEYPTYEIQHAVEYHYSAVAALYKDVLANTENSVDGLKVLDDETFLCPAEVAYIRPLRAVNSDGQWRIIVNNVKAHYETLSQTARVEHCVTPGHPCPLVPECYATKCVQKSIYHRFLVYDPYDYYFPFAIESFKMPSACACYNGHYSEPIVAKGAKKL